MIELKAHSPEWSEKPKKPFWHEHEEEQREKVFEFHEKRKESKESGVERFKRLEKASKQYEKTAEERHRELLGQEKESQG